jgi:phosphoribosylformimino-5-aminoimidazole carboxamide ribotide isomerase
MLIIPAIDLKEGKCVRLRQGKMDDSTVFSDSPVDIATQWVEQGAKRIHLVDLDGAFAGQPVNADIVHAIAEKHPDIVLQIGGGVRNRETVATYIEAGVQFVIIGTRAVNEPQFVGEVASEFSSNIIVGLDAKDGMVATDGWAKVSDVNVIDLAKQFEGDGVQSIIYTDIARDGMMQGVNIEATQKLAQAINIPVIASGGVTNMDDVKQLLTIEHSGVEGVITGRAIYEGTLDFSEAQTYCQKPD